MHRHNGVGAAFLAIALPVLSLAALSEACATEPTDPDQDSESAVNGCGTERWAVKTGTDPDVSKVNLTTAQDTTVTALVGLTAPKTLPASGRIAPTETTAFRLRNVTLQGFKEEADSDIHLILTDGAHTMNAELAAPSCVGAASPLTSAITKARTAFAQKYTASGSFQMVNETVSLVGIGFFDFLHGQKGGAANGAELHPVVDICFGVDCTLSGGFGDGGAGDGGVPDAGTDGGGGDGGTPGNPFSSIKNVFVILMENHNWSNIKGNSSAPYINGTLLPMGAHAENYLNVPGLHPSEPNYLWLEAGDNFGVTNDNLPSSNHQSTTQHLVTLLEQQGVSWKSYAEGITGSSCPVSNSGLYAPKHVPVVFFDDVMNDAKRCTSHVRPFTELAQDLASGATAKYNFITPNLCDDMHNSTGCPSNQVTNGDTWLAQNLPTILDSAAYKDNGAVFITWDESEGGDVPIGMIVLSPLAKKGYSNSIAYNHSSTLRTVQEIFGATPFLRAAGSATDLADLFDLPSTGGGGGGDAGAGGDGGGTNGDAGGGGDSGTTSSCAHDVCATGAKLLSTCDPCAAAVCGSDSWCCSNSWDAQCVKEVATSSCGRTCP